MDVARARLSAALSAASSTASAAVPAAVLSGAPSTVWALVRGDDVLAPTRAAGALLAPGTGGATRLAAAAAAHTALSAGWTLALARVLPVERGRTFATLAGAVAGLAIAALDLGTARLLRRHPRFAPVAGLPLLPQVADHVAFGSLMGRALSRPADDRR